MHGAVGPVDEVLQLVVPTEDGEPDGEGHRVVREVLAHVREPVRRFVQADVEQFADELVAAVVEGQVVLRTTARTAVTTRRRTSSPAA